MKRKLSCFLVFAILLCTVCILPISAYVRISYGADNLAARGELIKSGLRGGDICFTEADFRQALGVTRISSVTLLSLPEVTAGVLKVDGTPAVAGQVIDGTRLSSLSFTPASTTVEQASFTFCAGSSAGTTALTCTLRILDRINYAPTVLTVTETALRMETRSGVSVFGSMAADDPEGDELTYLVVDYPDKGYLTLTDEKSGAFRYTPHAGKSGSDSFSYVARDSYGNYSSIATVRIDVTDRGNTPVYSDMKNHPAHHAALVMTEKNIMIGQIAGGELHFLPNETLTRADFLVMAMKAAGISPAAGVERTWFDDNDEISDAVMPYVATAQLYGYVSGYFNGEGLFFEPNRAITRAEVAVILGNILNADTPAVLPVFKDASDIPAWAAADIYALTDAGILSPTEDGSIDARANITRADAALTLYALMQYEP